MGIASFKRIIRAKTCWAAGLLCVLVLFVACLLTFSLRPGRKITEANLFKIRGGMTKSQVEIILGCPAGTYSSLPKRTTPAGPPKRSVSPASPRTYRNWFGDAVTISIGFDRYDRVVSAECYPVYPSSWIVHLWDCTRRIIDL
jgi:hypothetical protein